MATSSRFTSETTECCTPVRSEDFSDNDADDLARAFAALADPVRLTLLSAIASAGTEGACVCDLIEPSGKTQSTVSHHLRVLREAGLVEGEKRGTWVWYRLVPSEMKRLRAALA